MSCERAHAVPARPAARRAGRRIVVEAARMLGLVLASAAGAQTPTPTPWPPPSNMPVVFESDDARDNLYEAAADSAAQVHFQENVPLSQLTVPCGAGSTLNPYGCVNGTFHQRYKDWIAQHPGLIEIDQHGVNHGERLGTMSYGEQYDLINRGLREMETWGLPTRPFAFAPPFASQNRDTITVEQQLGFQTSILNSGTCYPAVGMVQFCESVSLCARDAAGNRVAGPSCVLLPPQTVIDQVNARQNEGKAFVVYHVQDLVGADPSAVDPNKLSALRAILRAFASEQTAGRYRLMTFGSFYRSTGGPTPTPTPGGGRLDSRRAVDQGHRADERARPERRSVRCGRRLRRERNEPDVRRGRVPTDRLGERAGDPGSDRDAAGDRDAGRDANVSASATHGDASAERDGADQDADRDATARHGDQHPGRDADRSVERRALDLRGLARRALDQRLLERHRELRQHEPGLERDEIDPRRRGRLGRPQRARRQLDRDAKDRPEPLSIGRFRVYTTSTSLALAVQLENDARSAFPQIVVGVQPANRWVAISVPLPQLAPASTPFDRIDVSNSNGANVTFYVDDLRVVGK